VSTFSSGPRAEHQHHHGPPSTFDETDVFDAAFWDARYAGAAAIWSGKPNPQLVAEAAKLTPTTALDVGCGEGADAVWLAARGWQVTALDISRVALERAVSHARTTGVEIAARITWHQADLTEGVTLTGTYGLVSAQFMHLPQPQRDDLHRSLAALVADGGTLRIVGHHPSDLDTAAHLRPHRPDLLFTPDEIVALLDPGSWQIVTAEARLRSVVDGEGHDVDVQDAVLVARRAASTPEPG
jgi:SAM-dependent methyltransferase